MTEGTKAVKKLSADEQEELRARKALEALKDQAEADYKANYSMQEKMVELAKACGESLKELALWLLRVLSLRQRDILPELQAAALAKA